MKQTLTKNFVFVLFIVMACNEKAYAYLDPGTGSILLQGLIAAVAGAMATGGIYWSKIKNFFTTSKPKKEQKKSEDEIDE